MKRISTVLSVLLSGLIALICLWPGSATVAQIAATLDKNDPELRAILAQVEADAEKARHGEGASNGRWFRYGWFELSIVGVAI